MNLFASPWTGFLTLAAEPPPSSPGGNPLLQSLLFIGVMFAILYFLMIRPQRKRQREHMDLISGLKKGDRVVTRGGIHGVVTLVRDKEVVIKVDDNCRLTVSKPAVAAVAPDERPEGRKDKEPEKEPEKKPEAEPERQPSALPEEAKAPEADASELCDICRQPGRSQLVRSKEMARAARKGYVPTAAAQALEALGLTTDTWRSQAVDGRLAKPEWHVCDNCMNELRSYL